jgi:hypothetical protein
LVDQVDDVRRFIINGDDHQGGGFRRRLQIGEGKGGEHSSRYKSSFYSEGVCRARCEKMKLPSAPRLQRVELLLAVVVTLGLIGLHCMALFSAGPLWRDEISSLTLATKPSWREVWGTLVYDPFPALFFTTLRRLGYCPARFGLLDRGDLSGRLLD